MKKTGAVVAGIVMALLAPGAAHAEKPETLYAVGDSITRGDGLTHRRVERWPALVGGDYRVRLNAYGGRCLLSHCGASRPLVETFRELVLSHHPARVVVHIGANDMGHGRDRQLRRGYRLLRQQGRAAGVKVHIATVTPTATTLAAYPREWVEPQRLRINRWIRRTWPNSYVDLAAALEGPDGAMRPRFDSGDGLHPNALGAQALAAAVTAKLAPN